MRHGRRDITHAAIRDGLRKIGAVVYDTADVGNNFPDLVVGWKGQTYLVEVKRPGGKLRKGQTQAMIAWRGADWMRVESVEEFLHLASTSAWADAMPAAAWRPR